MAGLITTLSDDVLIVDFQQTKILDQNTVESIGAELQNIAGSTKSQKIIVDMNRIELMTSTMIGQLVSFNKKCTNRKVAVNFCNLTSQIKELFKITKLDSVFKISADREAALKKLK